MLQNHLETAKHAMPLMKKLYEQYEIKAEDTLVLITINDLYKINTLIELTKQQIEKTVWIILQDVIEEDQLQPYNRTIKVSQLQLKSILELYNLYMFRDNLFVLSEKKNTTITAFHLVENELISYEEYVKIGILQL